MDQRREAVSLGRRSFILGKVFQSIPLYFAHWEDALMGQDELDAAFAAVEEEALGCSDRECFSLLLMAFLARLNNGHTRFVDPVFDILPPLGLALRPVEDRWTVIASSAWGVHAGDVVSHIEDKPVEVWYEDLHRYTVGSAQSRTVQFGDLNGIFPALLGIFLPERYTVEVEDADGNSRTLTVTRSALDAAVPHATVGRWLNKHLAYVQVPSFLSPEFEDQALMYLTEFGKATCIVLDIRGNAGGSTPYNLIRALMDRPYRWWAESRPLNSGLKADLFGDSQLLRQATTHAPDPEAYAGRLILLVDRGTWSAAEDFAMPFKDNGRAILIGEPTGGSTGEPYFHSFENGMMFAVGMKRVHMPDGAKFEGVGLRPDRHVVHRRADWYRGRDPVLEEALARAEA